MSEVSSFTFGAVSVVGLISAYKVYQLFRYPSIESIEKRNTIPMKLIGDPTKITVYGFELLGEHPKWKLGISDDSPYVSRVEAFLRLAKVPYEKKESQGTMENPRGKVPFCNINGQMVDDSSIIIETIRNVFADDTNVRTIDSHLTEQDLAVGHLIRQLLFGSLYWVLLHQKFGTKFGRQEFIKNMKKKLPPIVYHGISALVFRNMHSCLFGSGIGRMPHAEIIRKGQEDVRSLSKLLGTKSFFFDGTIPTSYDCDVYCWTVVLFCDDSQIANQWVNDIQKECSNLVAHMNRMRDLLYPELKTL